MKSSFEKSRGGAEDPFYIVAKEPGAEHPAIPTWANYSANPADLLENAPVEVKPVVLESVPGAFQLLHVLSAAECRRLLALTESIGYVQDAAVSLPRSIRHNHSLTWVVDDRTSEIIWQRCRRSMPHWPDLFFGKRPLGLNNRFRFYRYRPGDFFRPHTDGAWPGSRIVDNQLIANAYADRWSQLSFLLFLSDRYQGGSTRFYTRSPVAQQAHKGGTDCVDIRTPAGAALCFPHGSHPLHCIHSSEKIISGTKYIIRSDVLFAL